MQNGEQIIQKMLLGQGTYKEKRENFMPTQLLKMTSRWIREVTNKTKYVVLLGSLIIHKYLMILDGKCFQVRSKTKTSEDTNCIHL